MHYTKIQYLTHSWSPIAMRCTPVSAGCASCWHLAMAKRLENNLMISAPRRAAYRGEEPELNQKELEAPLHLRKPARIGVQFMGDIAHDSIDGFWISAIWGIMVACPQHQFFILTKRPERFLKLTPPLPVLQNVWAGVSVEDQKSADERRSILLQIPAAHRWVSVEPALSPILIKWWLDGNHETGNKIDWLVCGGETGSGARAMHPDWVRSLRDQCQAAGVPIFIKTFPVDGKLSNRMEEWPEDVRIREMP